jgi:hypothetical protein
MKFRTTVLHSGKNITGMEIPEDVVTALGSGKKPPVRVTINGFTYRSSVAVMGGRYMVGISADNRAATGVAGGDEIDVDLVLDSEPREVAVPADFAAALDAEPAARTFFDGLSYSQRRWFVSGIEEAKKPETRLRRIDKAVERLASGRGQL